MNSSLWKTTSVLENMWLSSSLVTLAVALPLNSVILANPYEPVCVSCLLNIYGGTLLGLTLFLTISQKAFRGKYYAIVLIAFTVLALVLILHVIQITTVPKNWRSIYVIMCGIGFVALMRAFMRTGMTTVLLLLQFMTILSIYEGVNVIRIVNSNRNPYWTAVENNETRVTSHSDKKPLSHIFLIVFDEFSLPHVLQEEMLSHSQVPNLAKFSDVATWYKQAVSLHHNTERSIPVLLTGNKDIGTFKETFLNSSEKSDHLFGKLAQTHTVYISGFGVPYCSAFKADIRACLNFMRGFSSYFELIWLWWHRAVPGEFRKTLLADYINDAIFQLLDHSTGKEFPIRMALQFGQNFDNPTFTYIHEGLPHSPYIWKPDGSRRSKFFWEGPTNQITSEELSQMRDHYLEQITYTDRLFGEFLMELKKKNLYDKAMIIVTSDHGTRFNPSHPGRHSDGMDVEEVARVPLLVKLPGQRRGEIDEHPISLADVSEMILEEMALEQQKNGYVTQNRTRWPRR